MKIKCVLNKYHKLIQRIKGVNNSLLFFFFYFVFYPRGKFRDYEFEKYMLLKDIFFERNTEWSLLHTRHPSAAYLPAKCNFPVWKTGM